MNEPMIHTFIIQQNKKVTFLVTNQSTIKPITKSHRLEQKSLATSRSNQLIENLKRLL